MKNIYNATEQSRSFRRLVRQWFSSLLKRHTCNHREDFEQVLEKLQDIEDLIEIIARQIARWAKVNPGE
jgi:hypothetical protein